MKKQLIACALIAAAALPAMAQTNVGVSVSVNQPGVYGRIDIGNFPQPAVIYPQPVIIQQTPVVMQQQPIYLHVPPGHAKNWRKHCHKYGACNQRVYFVQERWYNDHYAHRHDDRHRHDRHDHHDRDDHRGHGHGHKHKGKD
jgi:hypothetical protein